MEHNDDARFVEGQQQQQAQLWRPSEHVPPVAIPPALAQVGLGATARHLSTNRKQLMVALHDNDWSVRAAAVQALGKQEGNSSIELLQQALHDENVSVRATAARSLGLQGKFASPGPLVAALHDPAWRVRAAAAQALGRLKGRTPVEPLVVLLDDENSSVRAAAVWALGTTGEQAPIEKLEKALYDKVWTVREAAVMALHEQGERVYMAQLLSAQLDEDSSVRHTVEDVLEQRYADSLGQKLKPEAKIDPTVPWLRLALALISVILLALMAGQFAGFLTSKSYMLNDLISLSIVSATISLINILYNGKHLHLPFTHHSHPQSTGKSSPAWHGALVAVVSICIMLYLVSSISPMYYNPYYISTDMAYYSAIARLLMLGINTGTIIIVNAIFHSKRN